MTDKEQMDAERLAEIEKRADGNYVLPDKDEIDALDVAVVDNRWLIDQLKAAHARIAELESALNQERKDRDLFLELSQRLVDVVSAEIVDD